MCSMNTRKSIFFADLRPDSIHMILRAVKSDRKIGIDADFSEVKDLSFSELLARALI